jgi:hypothetical protein
MQTLLTLSPLIIRILKIVVPVVIGLLLLPIIAASAILNKSTVTWPVVAPTQVAAGQTAYLATGWTISSPFGWRPNPDNPGAWELHDGIDLAGPMFCDGCAVPPMGDIAVVYVGWDQPYAVEPQNAGAGVVVDMTLQHPFKGGQNICTQCPSGASGRASWSGTRLLIEAARRPMVVPAGAC